MIGRARGAERAFRILNGGLLLAIAAVCVYPLLYVLAVSLSDSRPVDAGDVHLIPVQFTLQTYLYVFQTPRLGIVRGLLNSFLYTVVGTTVAVLTTYITAYVLSRPRFKGRHVVMLLFLISWVFEAGLIPTYIIYSQLGMVNSPLVMILPTAINTFLLLITRSFLVALPKDLEESAVIDGANDLQIMWLVYRPLSGPILATIAVFNAAWIWNSLLTPLVYLQDKALQPIQLILYNLLIETDGGGTQINDLVIKGHHIGPQNISSAALVLAIVPVVIFYPFAQRYLVRGITMGAVKE